MPSAVELEEVRRRLREDTPFWARNCATILNPARKPVRLEARPWQLRFDAALEAQRAQGQPMRAIVLKARKLGFSTWVQAKFMQRVTQRPFEYALVVAHLRSAGTTLADMAALMYANLPTEQELGMGFNIRPQLIAKNDARNGARSMTFGDRARPWEASIYETLTAGAKGGGRASTPSMVHGSEIAHWEDPDFAVGLLNAVPREPDTIVVLESTANGFNHFHDRWVRAVAGAEEESGGTYIPLFFGWQDNPFNAMQFTSDEARDRFERTIGDPDGGGDEDEPWLIEQFGVTLEQLLWRRATRDEECGGKLEVFHQEHPATPEQAFIGSGNPVFSQILVARAIKAATAAPEPVEGVLRGVEWRERKTRAGSIRVPQRAVWVPRDQMTPDDVETWGGRQNLLRVWEHPVNAHTQSGLPAHERRPDGQYVVFADVAQGRDTTAEVRDWSAIQVLDHVTRMQVASYRSRIALHDYPIVCLLVALYFNQAWLAPEKTGLGIGVVDALAKDYRYPRIYRTRRRGDDQRDGVGGDLLGWSTDPRTKPLMELAMGEAFKTGTHGMRCLMTAREFTTYVEDDRGKHGAQKGAHDDLAMAFMGAHRVASELRPRNPLRRSVRGHTVTDEITGY